MPVRLLQFLNEQKMILLEFTHVDPDMVHVIYLANTFENETEKSNGNGPEPHFKGKIFPVCR